MSGIATHAWLAIIGIWPRIRQLQFALSQQQAPIGYGEPLARTTSHSGYRRVANDDFPEDEVHQVVPVPHDRNRPVLVVQADDAASPVPKTAPSDEAALRDTDGILVPNERYGIVPDRATRYRCVQAPRIAQTLLETTDPGANAFVQRYVEPMLVLERPIVNPWAPTANLWTFIRLRVVLNVLSPGFLSPGFLNVLNVLNPGFGFSFANDLLQIRRQIVLAGALICK